MTASRQSWRFLAHARRLGIPDPVSWYILQAINEETAVPIMLRRAALMGSDLNLNPYGLGAQVRKLLSWDYRKRPGDYTRDPKDEPILVRQEDVRAALRGRDAESDCRTGWGRSMSATQGYLDKHAKRAWASSCYQYGYVLPSYGTSYDHCGRYVFRGCLDGPDGHHDVRRDQWRCGRLTCPVCYEQAIRLAAVRSTKRLMDTTILCKSVLGRRRQLIYHHYVVSVHPSRHKQMKTPEGVEWYRKNVYKQMKWLGYLGGATVYHPWSFQDGRQSYRPHFHVLAAGYVDRNRYLDRYGRRIMLGEMAHDPIVEINRRTGGDVYTKVSHASTALEVRWIMTYLLTHAGLRMPERSPDRGQAAGLADADGRNPDAASRRPETGRRNYGHAITYFGDASPNKFSAKTVLSRSRDAYEDISKIIRSWRKNEEKRGQLTLVSIQPVTCPPRQGGGMRADKSGGRLFDVDPRTAEYGDPVHMSVAEAGKYLRSLCPRADNALLAKSTDKEDPSDGPAVEPYRYAVVKLRYEKHGGVGVRSSCVVIALDPYTGHLCSECRGVLRVVVPAGGSGIPPPDDDNPDGGQRTDDDATRWTYYRPGGEHMGMGIPYYSGGGSMSWDPGVPDMPAGAPDMPLDYYLRLQGEIDDRIVRYVVATMRLQDPGVDRDVAGRAARRYLDRIGHPDKARDGWEDDLLAGVRDEYATLIDPVARPPGQERLDDDDDDDDDQQDGQPSG